MERVGTRRLHQGRGHLLPVRLSVCSPPAWGLMRALGVWVLSGRGEESNRHSRTIGSKSNVSSCNRPSLSRTLRVKFLDSMLMLRLADWEQNALLSHVSSGEFQPQYCSTCEWFPDVYFSFARPPLLTEDSWDPWSLPR
jgi:hypothetical protein